MRFKKQIPPFVDTNEHATKFISVLDGMQEYKEALVEDYTRFYNTPLLTNLLFLRKKAEAYAHPRIPEDFKKEQLDALILNSNDIMALKGSYQGLRLWLWCLTFGNITDNYGDFYPIINYIIPSDEEYGYLSNVVPPETEPRTLYLFSGADNFGTQSLSISITTKYHWMVSLKKYIEDNIREFIGFTDANTTITIELLPGAYVTNSFPNQYFVIP